MRKKSRTEEPGAGLPARRVLVPAALVWAAALASAAFADGPGDWPSDWPKEEPPFDDIPDVRVPAVTMVPIYPAVARRDRIEGEVTVCFRIAPDGRILDAEITSSTHEIFEEPALEAIQASTFEPLPPDEPLSDKPVCRTFRFRLDPVEPSDEV